MPTLRDIKRRIMAVKSIQKITKAMKMVAAARLRRAQDRIISARPYARKIDEILKHFISNIEISGNPLIQKKEIKNIAIVVVTSDRGLCGSFNTNIIRATVNIVKERKGEIPRDGRVKLICIGKKGYDYFIRRSGEYDIISHHIGVFGRTVDYSWVKKITDELVNGYLSGKFDKVEIVYNEFKSVIQQRIVLEQFLPLAGRQDQRGDPGKLIDYIYEPDAIAILNELLPKHLETQIWRILLESNAAEQAARMTAMDNATENAVELLRDLQLSFNKARQAAITKEMIEIASGSEALKKAGMG
jgi:F-type H+-transporting ATPase subunit gamma